MSLATHVLLQALLRTPFIVQVPLFVEREHEFRFLEVRTGCNGYETTLWNSSARFGLLSLDQSTSPFFLLSVQLHTEGGCCLVSLWPQCDGFFGLVQVPASSFSSIENKSPGSPPGSAGSAPPGPRAPSVSLKRTGASSSCASLCNSLQSVVQ